MTEQFVTPNGATDVAITNARAPEKVNHDALAQAEYAKVLQDGRVLELMTYIGTLYQLSNVTVIENQVQYDQVIDAFDSSKKLIKLIDERRVEIVGFPTKTISLINGLFKQLKENVDKVKGHFSSLIEAKKSFDKAQHEMGQLVQDRDAVLHESGDGVSTIEFTGDQAPPSNVVKSARGAKVHSRSDIEIEITDPIAFLKVVVSSNKRYADIHAAVGELVEIKVGVLKRLIKEGKRRKLAGVEITQVSKTV